MLCHGLVVRRVVFAKGRVACAGKSTDLADAFINLLVLFNFYVDFALVLCGSLQKQKRREKLNCAHEFVDNVWRDVSSERGS